MKLRNAAKEMIIAPQPGGQQLDKTLRKMYKDRHLYRRHGQPA